MNKTLITKLSGRIANSELLRLGEIRITIDKEISPSSKSRSLDITVNKDTAIEIVGEGYFTDERLSANKGKSIVLSQGNNTVYVSNDNVILAVLNKYNITKLYFEHIDNISMSSDAKHKHFDLSSFKYCNLLTDLVLPNTSTTGDLSEISNLPNLTYLHLSNTLINGDLSSLKNLSSLSYITIESIAITGDLSSLSGLTSLTTVNLSRTAITGDLLSLSGLTSLDSLLAEHTQITGNLSSLSGLTKLTRLYLRETKTNGDTSVLRCYNLKTLHVTDATFNVNSMKAFNKLTSIILYNSSIRGDIATLSDTLNLLLVATASVKSCTWSSRKSSAKIISMPYYLITDNIDKMLQDQAQCQADVTSSYKTIVAKGTRTSASDAAIQTLQTKGYTVTILPTD